MVFRGILPAAPSFSSQLGAALGQGIGGGVAGAGDLLSEMMKEKMKQQSLFNQVRSLMPNQGGPKEDGSVVSEAPQTGVKRPEILDVPDEAIDLLEVNPETRVVAKSMRRRKEKATEDYEHKQVLQRSFTGMIDLLPDVGFAVGPPGISPFNAANRSEWEEYRLSLVGAARDLFNKGILTNQKFKYILDNVPEHGDRTSVKIGKLRGIGKELGLNIDELNRLYPKEGKGKSASASNEPMVKMTKNGKTKLVPKSRVKIEMGHGASVVK